MTTKHSVFIIIFTLPLFFMACSPKLIPNSNTGSSAKVMYPQFADTSYVQYLLGFTSKSDIESQSKFQEAIVGKNQEEWMQKPYGVTVEKSKIYVADIALPGINIIDLDKKTYNQFKPVHRNFSFILTMAIDENDDRYLLDTKSMTVLIYNANGVFKDEFKVPENEKPARIRVKEDKIYIGDITTGTIYIYSKDTHKLIDQIPKKGVVEGNKEFVYMVMDFDLTDRYVYIMDAGSYQVKIFTYDGELVKSFGEMGNGYGQFVRPKSIAVDKEGIIMVADAATNAVQMFNEEGQPLMAFGMPYEIETGKTVPSLYLPISMFIDYNNLDYFKPYVDSKYNLKYVIYVVNQFGGKKLKVYGRLELKSVQSQ